ncbi:MAG: response regulator [Chitinophagaceae bacterium]|nr:response regulator [Chitinophagaceae bacterium]
MNNQPGDGNNTLTASSSHQLHVLLAEDNLLLQQAMKIVLAQRGFKVSVVSNGRQAVDSLKQQQADIVLMAINMPVMDGVEATHAIRNFNQYTPIIAFTSYDETSMLQHIKGAGMNGFLSKYASPDHIYQTIIQYTSSIKQED